MPQDVRLIGASRQRTIKLDKIDTIDQHSLGEGFLYFVRNDFSPIDYEQGITLFAFAIVKETACFLFLSNGQRIAKNNSHRKLDKTPRGALRKAQSRAATYMNILMTKARSVNEFLQAIKGNNRSDYLADIRGFAKFAASVENVDDIEPEAYREMFLQNKEMQFP